jgi:hypothetical protein
MSDVIGVNECAADDVDLAAALELHGLRLA